MYIERMQANYAEECRAFETELVKLQNDYRQKSNELESVKRERDDFALKAEAVESERDELSLRHADGLIR